MSLKAVPDLYVDVVKDTFNAGFYKTNLSDLSELIIVEDVVNTTNPSYRSKTIF